jgi:hypothetical protein
MIVFYLFFLLSYVNADYITTNKILTNFKDKKNIINLFTKPIFYNKFLDIIEASNIKLEPKIKNSDSEIIFPQTMIYYSKPKIKFLSCVMNKMKVRQQWERNEDIFKGNIKTKYLEFNITLEPILDNNKIFLQLEGKLIKKNFLIPEKYLDEILKEFEEIFYKICQST